MESETKTLTLNPKLMMCPVCERRAVHFDPEPDNEYMRGYRCDHCNYEVTWDDEGLTVYQRNDFTWEEWKNGTEFKKQKKES